MMRNKIMKPTKQTKSTKGSKNEPKVESSPETIFVRTFDEFDYLLFIINVLKYAL